SIGSMRSLAQSGCGIDIHFSSASSRRLSRNSGSRLRREISRIVFSSSPGGSVSDSMSVTKPCGYGRARVRAIVASSWAADMSGPGEVDHYLPGLALEITDLDCVAVARGELREQGKGIVVIDEAHGLARAEAVHGAEYRGVPKALRDAARVENVGRLGQLVGGSHVRSRLSGCWEGSAPCR